MLQMFWDRDRVGWLRVVLEAAGLAEVQGADLLVAKETDPDGEPGMILRPPGSSSRPINHRSRRCVSRHLTLFSFLLALGVVVGGLTAGPWWDVSTAERVADRVSSGGEGLVAAGPVMSNNGPSGPTLGDYPNTSVRVE